MTNAHLDDCIARARRRAITGHVLAEVATERIVQQDKFGEQNVPDGTKGAFTVHADVARDRADSAAELGQLTWAHVLEEEFYEALAEVDTAKLRAELIQVAAVAVAWAEAIDRRTGNA